MSLSDSEIKKIMLDLAFNKKGDISDGAKILRHIKELDGKIKELQKQNNWISVEDRLPKIQNHDYYGKRYSIPVLIYDEYKNPQCVRWDFKSKGWVNSFFNDGSNCWDYPFDEIMLWQPLPEAPNEY